MRQATEKQTEQTEIRAEKKGTGHKYTESKAEERHTAKREAGNKGGQTEGPRSSQRPQEGRAEAQDTMVAVASKSSL